MSVHECGATPKYARAYDAREGAFFLFGYNVMCQGYWQKGSRNVDSTTCLLVQTQVVLVVKRSRRCHDRETIANMI